MNLKENARCRDGNIGCHPDGPRDNRSISGATRLHGAVLRSLRGITDFCRTMMSRREHISVKVVPRESLKMGLQRLQLPDARIFYSALCELRYPPVRELGLTADGWPIALSSNEFVANRSYKRHGMSSVSVRVEL